MMSLMSSCIKGARKTLKTRPRIWKDFRHNSCDDSELLSSLASPLYSMPSTSNLYFQPLRSDVALAVRHVRGSQLGKLLTVRGIVTRVSEVKPLLLVNAYTCDTCGSEIFQDISNKQFTPLVDCPSEACKLNNTKSSLNMQTRACRFSPFQEAKIQEMVRLATLFCSPNLTIPFRRTKSLLATFLAACPFIYTAP